MISIQSEEVKTVENAQQGSVSHTSTEKEITMQDKPVALVTTGANKGIGFQIAKDLAAHGFTFLVGSRNPEHGEMAVPLGDGSQHK